MPTYQYLCNDCGHEFEEFQSISDLPLTDCPECGGHVKRVITGGAGFLFKGSGFYITDYRSKNYQDAARKDVSTGSTPSSSDSKKTEPKPKSSDK